jgi:hypothetical protein
MHVRTVHGHSASELLRFQFRNAHRLLDGVLEWPAIGAVYRDAVGTSASIAALYAQLVVHEDFSVNGVLAGVKPLALSSWAGRTGLSELPPLGGRAEWRDWAREVRIEPDTVRRYASAVYASTDTWIANLSNESLEVSRADTPARLLSALLLTQCMRRGQIACLGAESSRR